MKKLSLVLALLGTALVVACSEMGEGVSNPAAPSASVSAASTAARPQPAELPVAAGSSAIRAARPQPDLPVTATIHELDSNGIAGDISSDGLGSYSNGVGAVRSVLAANAYNNLTHGDWQFDTRSSPARGVGHRFDADDAVQPGDPRFIVPAVPPYWGFQVLKTGLQMECTYLGKSMLTMTAGSSMTCGMLNHFVAGSANYGLHTALSFTGHPETTDVLVACNAADSGGCSDWFIDPIGLDRAVGRLALKATKPNKPATHVGDFYVRFRIHLTRP